MNEISTTALCVTWNVLAEKYSNSPIPYELRLNQIKYYLHGKPFSIICLQEVNLETFTEDFGEFSTQYTLLPNIVGKTHKNKIGNAIFMKQDEWNVLDKINSSTGVHIIAVHMKTGIHMWISNIHLKAGYNSGELTRVAQIKSNIKRIKNKGDYPAVICGDFNDDVKPRRKLYSILRAADFRIKSNLLSCYHGGKFYAFDHAMSNSFKIRYVPHDYELIPIPNDEAPSDHYPIMFKIYVE